MRKKYDDMAVYEFMKIYMQKNLVPPTIRTIQSEFNIPSTDTVWRIIQRLEIAGYVEKTGKSYKILSAQITFDE